MNYNNNKLYTKSHSQRSSVIPFYLPTFLDLDFSVFLQTTLQVFLDFCCFVLRIRFLSFLSFFLSISSPFSSSAVPCFSFSLFLSFSFSLFFQLRFFSMEFESVVVIIMIIIIIIIIGNISPVPCRPLSVLHYRIFLSHSRIRWSTG